VELTNRVALITGGKRIGVVVAGQLAARGADVVLGYARSRDEAEQAARSVRASGRRAEVVQADLSQSSGCQALVSAATLRAKYGITVDRQSAHEMITARIQSAQQAAAQQAGQAAPAPGASVQTPMTADQYQRDVRRQAQEMAREQREADRQARADRRVEQQTARAQERQREQIMRTGTRILTSRAGQDVLRTVFGTLFGSKR